MNHIKSTLQQLFSVLPPPVFKIPEVPTGSTDLRAPALMTEGLHHSSSWSHFSFLTTLKFLTNTYLHYYVLVVIASWFLDSNYYSSTCLLGNAGQGLSASLLPICRMGRLNIISTFLTLVMQRLKPNTVSDLKLSASPFNRIYQV